MELKELGLITVITIFCIYLSLRFLSSFAIFFIIIFGLILFSFSRMIQLRKFDSNLVKESKHRVKVSEPISKFCFNCRKSYPEDMIFCQNCGIRI